MSDAQTCPHRGARTTAVRAAHTESRGRTKVVMQECFGITLLMLIGHMAFGNGQGAPVLTTVDNTTLSGLGNWRQQVERHRVCSSDQQAVLCAHCGSLELGARCEPRDQCDGQHYSDRWSPAAIRQMDLHHIRSSYEQTLRGALSCGRSSCCRPCGKYD